MTPATKLSKLNYYLSLPSATRMLVLQALSLGLMYRAKWAITEEVQTKLGGLQ